jgi:isopenicillin-N epimerase
VTQQVSGIVTAPALPDASAWTLDPGVAYLNHGGFGAAPRPVLARQQALREDMERNPVRFLVHDLPALLQDVRAQLAAFLRADEDGVVFTDNATTGTQTVLAQFPLGAGDEVLATDHCYPAVLKQLQRVAARSGATVKVVPVPLPVTSRAQVAAAVLAGLGGRTRLVVIDHIASCSGLVFPVEQIAAECRRRGVPVLVDGAHAAGMLPVDLARLGADFWVGNLHKWVCAPKASAVLSVAPEWRERVRPLVASHGIDDGFLPAFDWTGTQDPTALLAVPAAVEFFDQAGWQAVRARNHALARDGADLVARRLGTGKPVTDEMAGAMRLVQLPAELSDADARALERRLLHDHQIVVPVTYHDGWRWLRLSAQLYNTISDYERLAAALSGRY